jgi:tetratricopeptide (TPR) repeat protein
VRAAALVLAALLLSAAAAGAGEPDPLAFADSLCQAGDYFRAVGEYKRALYLLPEGSPHLLRARLHLGACTARAGEYAEAAELLRPLTLEAAPLAEPALFELALVYYLAAQPEQAAQTFEGLATRFPDSPRAEESRLLAGYARLAAGDNAAAAAAFQALEAAVPCAADLAEAARHPALPERSPLVAGLLSAALPGAGQLYCGRPGQAAASLLLTGLSVFGAWAAWSNDYQGAGTLAAFVAATAYAGSIRSAVWCARERNRVYRQRWLTGLAEGCGLVLVPGQVAFAY